MFKTFRFSQFATTVLAIGVILILCGCNLSSATPTLPGQLTPVRLTVQAVNATEAFNMVGQVIHYSYVVMNTGNTALAGPVSITDDKVMGVACPNVNTVGNLDDKLDLNESITCAGDYGITSADLNSASVTNNATAAVGEVLSVLVTTTVHMAENKALFLVVSANPTSYNQAGQTITYIYTISNIGAPTLGPAQFIVNDDRIGAPINCGSGSTTLATNQTVSCTATYIITPNDMTVPQLSNNATASGGGAGVIQSATVTITNLNLQTSPI